MPELPTMDFLLAYPDGHIHEHAPSPTSKETIVETYALQPHRLDSAIDLSDFHSISPTQQPIGATEHSASTVTRGLKAATRQSTPSVSYRQAYPTIKFPFRHQRLSNDSKGVVVAAAEIVEQLEDKMCTGLSAINEVLRINKEATQRISELNKRTDYISSVGGSIVAVAAAHHVTLDVIPNQ
ncbi:hypothetical protein BDW75DRAFT_240327 [Aspergillus navahoensis]